MTESVTEEIERWRDKMSFSPKTRSRSWMVTAHVQNMKKAGLSKEEYENPELVANTFIKLWEESGTDRKAAASVCVSASGVYHMHLACYGNTTTLNKVAQIFFHSHIEPQLGGKKQLTEYLLKKGKYEEKGEQVLYASNIDVIDDKQGKRSDLDEIESMLHEGYTPDMILQESFYYYKYEKMIKSAFTRIKRDKTPQIKEMHNEWHFGQSGTGKTYTYARLYEEGADSIYLCNDYSNSGGSAGGFDQYMNNPTDILFMDEFRGNMPFSTLLNILDKYSRNQIHCRYTNAYMLWTKVIISTIYSPEALYKLMIPEDKRQIDSYKQLLRRLNVIVYHWKDTEGHFRTFRLDASNYQGAEDIIKKAEQFEKEVSYEEYKKSQKRIEKFSEEATVVEGGEILD